MTYTMLLLELKVKTPLVVGSRVSKNWYAYTDTSIISGRLIWGALFSKVAKKNPELVEQEHLNPRTVISSLICLDEQTRCIPSHSFNFKCKTSDKIVYTDGKTLYNRILEGEDALIKLIEEKTSHPCRIELRVNGTPHTYNIYRGLMVPAKGLVKRIGGEYTTCTKPRTISIEMVAIDKTTRSSKSEMLFTYEALPEGIKYYSLMITPSTVLEKFLKGLQVKLGDKIELRIGRGVSRGYGLVEVALHDETKLLEELNKYYMDSIGNDMIALYALSPVINQEISQSDPYSNIPVPPGTSIKEYPSKRKGVFSTGTMIVRGWSRLYNTPTPTLRALAPGTIIVYEIKDKKKIPKNIPELLITMQRLGGPGMNFFVPIQAIETIM